MKLPPVCQSPRTARAIPLGFRANGAAQAGLRCSGIAQQEIDEGVAVGEAGSGRGPARREGKNSAGCVGIGGVEIVVPQVHIELDGVGAAMPDYVVIEFEVTVVAEGEQRRVAQGGELAAEGNLRVAQVERIGGDTFKSGACGESSPRCSSICR